MIELGCHSRNYGNGTPEETFSWIKQLGFDCIDVDGAVTIRQEDVLEDPEKTAEYTRALSERYELPLSEYVLGNVIVDGRSLEPTDPDPGQRERMYEYFTKICGFAQQAGFTSIMTSAGSLRRESGYERSFETAAETLDKMVGIAADNGILLHVEPGGESLLNTPDNVLEMIRIIPGLRLTLDFSDFQVNGIAQREVMRLLEHTGHLHARQAAEGWGNCPFEHGEIDYDRVVKRLRGLNWSGAVAIKFWNGPAEEAAGMSPVEQTILMRYHLKQLIKKYN